MAQTAKKPVRSILNEHTIFALFVALAVFIAPIAHQGPEPVRLLVLERHGIFENLTVLFYLMVLGLGVKAVYERYTQGWRSWWVPGVLALIGFIAVGEEFRWFLPYILEDPGAWPILSLQDILALSFEPVPERTSFDIAIVIAVTRFSLLIAVLYGLGALIYFQKGALKTLGKHVKTPYFAYGVLFVGLTGLAILLDSDILPGRKIFEECLEMCAALALAFCQWGLTSYNIS